MVRYPQQTKSLVEMVWLRAKQKQGQIDQKVLESTIRAKIGLPGINRSVTQQDITVIETYHPGIAQNVLNWCADISQLRVEEKGSITYHTHWFILIKRLSLPSLVIAGLLTWVIAIIFGNLPYSFGLALLTLFGIVTIGMMGWWMYRYLDWQNDCYVITRDEVQDIQKKPLSNEQKRAAPLENINSVDFQRIGIIGILLNIGTVSIHIGEDTFTFDNVYDPAEVQSELFKKLGEKNFMEKKAALDAEQERMAEWISAYHRVVEAERKGKTPGS